MPRIRTVKPEFYRHKLLQQLERENPNLKPMLVFTGLWCMADKAGRFEWDPDILHLDILPFIPFDMDETLGLLRKSGLVAKYSVAGKDYGVIPTFPKHQRITGKEHDAPARYPDPSPDNPPLFPPDDKDGETPGKPPSNDGEAPGIPGKGKGKGKGKGLRVGRSDPLSESEIDSKFDEFWKAYPQSGRHAKQESRRRFGAVVKRGEIEQLVEGFHGYLDFLKYQKDDQGFNQRPMYAKTFLNERWREFIGYKYKAKL